MSEWYASLTIWQKRWLYFVSLGAVLVYGIGLIPLALLIFLELGKKT